MNALIINFAPTGMVPTKSSTPHVPISCSEIVDDVLMAATLGASIAHIHARDDQDGKPTSDPDVYARIIENIRSHNKDIIICVSLSGRTSADPQIRAAPLSLPGHLKPDMASLTLSSLNFTNQASLNEPSTIAYLAGEMDKYGIMPELEIFDLGMANSWRYMTNRNQLRPPFYFNVIAGNIYGIQACYSHFAAFAGEIGSHGILSFGGIGKQQLTAHSLAVAGGFHVRVGLEDNIWLDANRTQLATNKDLMERVNLFARLHERPIMGAQSVRKMLNLNYGNENYGRIAMEL